VADAFIGPRPSVAVVRHKDGDPGNNKPENLLYGSQAENLHDTYTYGKKMGQGKLYAEDVRSIRADLARGVPQAIIAKNYGVSQQTISNINCKRTLYYID
jgi:DNA invertase Pin-like site-specific DNA recombinase